MILLIAICFLKLRYGGGEEDKNPILAILLIVINCFVQNLALQPNMRSCGTSLVYA